MPSRKAPYERYIVSLNMNKLEGRMLNYPAKNRTNNILLIGDLGTDIGFWWGLAKSLHDLGNVTMPDLPGIGGMDSFYKIKKVPDIDAYADYMASFIKMRFRKRKFITVGVGFGFIVLTRTFQRYPELQKNVKFMVSLGGFADHEDYILPKARYLIYSYLSSVFSRKLFSVLFRRVSLNSMALSLFYRWQMSGVVSESDLSALAYRNTRRFIKGDARTLMAVISELTRFSNCDKQLELPLEHVDIPTRYLDWSHNEQHLRVIFPEINYLPPGSKINRYPIKRDKRSAAVYLPNDLKSKIRKA